MKYYMAKGYYLRYPLHRYSEESRIVSYYNLSLNRWIRYPMKWCGIERCLDYYELSDDHELINITKKEVTKYIISNELEK